MDGLGREKFASFCPVSEATPPASVLRDGSLPQLFKAAAMAFRQQALVQMRAAGIPELFPGVTPLILHLGDEDGLTISELARRCRLDNSTMTPLIDELERRHLVTRARAPEDRRVLRLYLTPHGRELEPRLRHILLHLQDVAFSDIPSEDLVTMRRVLERLIFNLENRVQTPDSPLV